MIENLYEIVTSITATILYTMLGLGVIFAGYWVSEKYRKSEVKRKKQGSFIQYDVPSWKLWAIGITVVILLMMLVYPSLDALKKVSCRSASDLEVCLEGGDNDERYFI